MATNPAVTVTVDHPREAGGGDDVDHGLPGAGPAELASSVSTMATPLLLNPAYARTKSLVSDELRNFRISLKWCALDHSSPTGKVVSYVAFATLALAVPAATSLAVRAAAAPEAPPSPINRLVQLPTSALAAISFFTLSSFFRRYGLRQLLFLDGLRDDSGYVRRGYAHELDRAFKYLTYILLPSFSIELAHKVVFFARVSVSVPFLRGVAPQFPCNSIAFLATLASWVYRTGVFLLVCVLFRLTCELQILRLQGFRKQLEGCAGSDAGAVFKEHARIRRQLLVTSHRYRVFIICCFVVITISQLGAMLLVLSSKAQRNFFNSGDLLVCSVVQLSGFLMCVMGAARITHRAQALVAIAAWWHMTLTSSAAAAAPKLPLPPVHDASRDLIRKSSSEHSPAAPPPPAAAAADYTAIETRKALVKYLQHNVKGITLYGYALDRGLLHTLFAFEMSLVLWILSKVVVLSS